MPTFQKYFRRYQESSGMMKSVWRLLYHFSAGHSHIEIPRDCKIGPGLYIGQENRGIRKGTPIIGDNVWIGINSTVVGKIKIGNDVLIAPNTYVNQDVPSHSIVFGNPCIIKHKEHATQEYINRTVE